MNKYLSELSGLSPVDAGLLEKIEETLPILSDLSHADALLCIAGNQPNTAIIIAQANPHTVSSVFPCQLIGKQVGKKNAPLVFHAFKHGKPARGTRTLPMRTTRTAEAAFPIFGSDGRIIAVVGMEANMIEHERLKKKSHVLRRSLTAVIKMAMSGQLHGAKSLAPIGEHDGLMVVDGTGQIQYVSSATENLYRKLGHPSGLVGSKLSELNTDESVFIEALEEGRCIERETSQRNLVWLKKAIPLLTDESAPWLAHHRGRNSQFGGALLIVTDITEQREKEQALRIKSAMIQEIHHRVKNNLQTIAALLRLQSRRTTSAEVEAMLKSSINRILSIAVVHEFLSHDQNSVINIREVCQRILHEVTHGILDPDKSIALRLEGANLYLPAQQATSCALIVNELLQNAVKHGYEGRTTGTVVVRLMEQGDELAIEIADDGIGFSNALRNSDNGHLGMQIIRTLVKEDLKGCFELANGNGVTARITFPRLAPAPNGVESMTD